jgi:hypothetical protein
LLYKHVAKALNGRLLFQVAARAFSVLERACDAGSAVHTVHDG